MLPRRIICCSRVFTFGCVEGVFPVICVGDQVEHMHDVNAEAAVKHCASKHFGYRVDEVMEAEYFLLQALPRGPPGQSTPVSPWVCELL